MSNFMGPMAPPPAAQPQPQALDFKTDPNQRQRFRQFMRERVGSGPAQAPAAMPNGISTTMPTPSMPMPQMPMMPQPAMMPPMPMDAGIDVFSPQYMNQIPMQPSAGFHEGGIVGGLNDLGQMSSQMVEALNTTIYGSGQGGGGGYGGGMPPPPSGPMSTGGGFGGGNMPPPLPPVANSVYQPGGGTDSSGPVASISNDGFGSMSQGPLDFLDGMNIPRQDEGMPVGSVAPSPGDVNSAWRAAQADAKRQRDAGFMGRVQLPGEGRYEDFVQQYNYNLMNPNQQPLMSNLMDVGPTGGVTSGQMPPGFTSLPPGELGFTENMMGPIQGYAGGSKYFDESTGLYSGPERLGPEYKFADGGPVPPRETTIRGQEHMLTYITPDEADILEALGGTGEAGPMGIPSYPEPGMGGDSDSRSGSGNESGGSSSGGGGGGGGNNNSGNDSDNASDDEMGDVGVMNGPGYSGPSDDDPFAGEEGDDFGSGNYGNDDGSFNPSDFVDYGVDDAAANRTQLEQAVKAGMLTSAVTGQPVNTIDPVTGKVSGQVMAGTKAEQQAAKEAYNQLQSGILGGQIESSGTTGTSNAVNSGLLGSKLGVTIDDLDIMNMTTPEVEALANSILGSGFNAAPGTMQANQMGTMPALDSRPSSASTIDKAAAAATGLTGKNLDAVVGYDKYGAPVMSGAAYGKNVDLTDQERALGNFMAQTVSGQNRPDRNMLQDIETQMSSAIDRQTLDQSGSLDKLGIFADVLPGVGFAKAVDEVLGVAEDVRKSAAAERLTDIVESGHYGVTDAGTGQLVGTVNPTGGIFGTGTYSGRPGYDPFASGSVFDPETNSYTVTDGSGYDQSGGGDDNVLLPLPPEEVPASTTPNQMPGMGAPSAPTAPGPVLAPSTRTSAPFSGQMPVGYGMPQTGQINPYSLAEMQRYQQMLARLGQSKSPIGLANGGSVLDAAAGKFLESLTAA